MEGKAYANTVDFMRRATANTIGSITTKPASKKMGKPNSSDATPSANGARFSPKVRIMASASDCAPPDVSTSRPSIAPKLTKIATPPSVPPKFFNNTSFTMACAGMPVASAVSRLTTVSVSSAWTRQRIIINKIKAMAAAAISSSVPELRV